MKETIKSNKLSLVVMVLFCIFYICYCQTFSPHVSGDGLEYIMQTVAFQNHLSFGITVEDIEQAKVEFYREADFLNTEYYDNPRNNMHEYGNVKYSNHFGAYSALVMPIKLIVTALGMYPIWAFYITNFLLYFFAVLVIYFALNVDTKKKCLIILLTIVNPALFYLDWTHSEVYIYAFTVIGLVFYYNKQYARSILFLNIAAMQNLGILPFALVVGVNLIIDKISEYIRVNGKFGLKGFLKEYTTKIILHGFCYVPGVLPVILTFFRFGTVSLVADVARESKYLIKKALDYIFDLNLGIFPYEPIILLLFIIMIVIGLKRYTCDSLLNLLGIGGIFYIISNQLQINSGMQFIMRYNVWIIPMMIFFVILNWEKIWKTEKGLSIVGISECIITAVITMYITFGGGYFTCNQFSPWAKWVMNIAPGLYNPTHGIFYSRVTGQESYYSAQPIIYTNNNGHVRKILLSAQAEQIFYSDSWLLTDDVGNTVDKKSLRKVFVDEGDYAYINLKGNYYHANNYSLGDVIHFYSDEFNADKYVITGLSHKEDWGTWTDGDSLVMLMRLKTESPIINCYIDIASTFYQPQRVFVLINDNKVYDTVVEGDQDISFSFENPGVEILKITLLLPDSISPSKVMGSIDGRNLGIGLLSMTLFGDNSDIPLVPEDGVIYFNKRDYNASKYVLSGLSHVEDNATWTEGNKFIMAFSVSDSDADDNINITMDLLSVINGQQQITITVNENEVFNGTVNAGDNAISFDVDCSHDGKYYMIIYIPDAISPKDLGMSVDERKLGIMIKTIKIKRGRNFI